MIREGDANMLEEVLRVTDLSKGLCLVLNSPGGDALAAERIVHTCRVYSGNKFEVIVPRRAKSAATMIALGADKIYMGETSALGPIDPQIIKKEEDGTETLFSADAVIKSYDDLLRKAIGTKGHIEPYLQQLSRYDAADIEELRRAHKLAEDIAVRCLGEGMLKGKSQTQIRRQIAVFLKPEVTKSHARDIYYADVNNAGLNVQSVGINDQLWNFLSEIHTRADYYVSTDCCKLIESPSNHFIQEPPPREE